jgi:magnesium transporter
VIGLAMICNMVAAAAGGIHNTQGLHRLKIDPAVGSSPFVTTVTDIVGFFAFLSIATLWFGLR